MDIQEAPTEIRQSYKLYFKMKSQLLDQTLGDIFEEDGFNILDNSNEIDTSIEEDVDGKTINISGINLDSLVDTSKAKDVIFSNVKELRENNSDVTNIVNENENHVIKDFEPLEVSKQNENAWGNELNKKPNVIQKKVKAPVSSSSFKPTQTLFKSQSFSKRNPRKSFSRQNSETSQGSNLSQNSSLLTEVIPDLEIILSQKARDQIDATPIPSISVSLQKHKEVNKEIDIGWLNRTSAENGIAVPKPRFQSYKNKTFGLGNIDLNKINKITSENVGLPDGSAVDEIDEPDNIINEDDEVVAESDNEEGNYRQPTKRRRIMPQTLEIKTEKIDLIKELKDVPKTEISNMASNLSNSKRNEENTNGNEKITNISVKKSAAKTDKKRKRNNSESSSDDYSNEESNSKKSQATKMRKTGVKENQRKSTRVTKKQKVCILLK